MNDKLFKILKKVYYKKRWQKDADGYQVEIQTGDVYNSETETYHFSTNVLSQSELLILQESNYPLNDIQLYKHNQIIHGLKDILKHENLSLSNLLSAFIAGFGSFPRGRQPIISYMFANALPEHDFINQYNHKHCEVCGLQNEFWVEVGHEIFRLYWGYSWSECGENFLIDLEEFSNLPLIIPTQDDVKIFLAVIDMIRNAPNDETPGKLEQRIMKSKIVPNCEKYRLRGQLLALAELGVMPNDYIKPLFDGFTDTLTICNINVSGSPRSDVILPLSGWRGKNRIEEERYMQLFGELITKYS